jgi:hypothetical protein
MDSVPFVFVVRVNDRCSFSPHDCVLDEVVGRRRSFGEVVHI